MKKILLIGGNGFIGRNLKEFLGNFTNEYDVVAPSRYELNILDEISVKDYLSKDFFDVVIHAAICNPVRGHITSVQNELEQDIRGFYNFEKYQKLFGKMIYLGSGAEYDKTKDIVSVSEEDFMNNIPKNQYGLAKYVIGKSIEKSDNIYNLRIFGLFGKYENWRTTFISGACCKALKGLPITIRKNVYFDYMYIDDFCKIVKWFVDNIPKYRTYNMSTGMKVDLISIAVIINKLIDKVVPVYVCEDGLANEYTADNKRLMSEIGNDFRYTLHKNAIGELLDYYRKHIDDVDLYSLLYQR